MATHICSAYLIHAPRELGGGGSVARLPPTDPVDTLIHGCDEPHVQSARPLPEETLRAVPHDDQRRRLHRGQDGGASGLGDGIGMDDSVAIESTCCSGGVINSVDATSRASQCDVHSSNGSTWRGSSGGGSPPLGRAPDRGRAIAASRRAHVRGRCRQHQIPARRDEIDRLAVAACSTRNRRPPHPGPHGIGAGVLELSLR